MPDLLFGSFLQSYHRLQLMVILLGDLIQNPEPLSLHRGALYHEGLGEVFDFQRMFSIIFIYLD